MTRPHFFIRLSPDEADKLKSFMSRASREYGLRARCRAQAVWFSQQGETVTQIAQRLKMSERSIWKWLKTYEQKGLEGLKGKYFYHKL